MGSVIPGSETDAIFRASDLASGLVADIRYLEARCDPIGVVKAANYAGRTIFSALIRSGQLGDTFDTGRFLEEVDKIREEMGVDHYVTPSPVERRP